MAERSYEIHNDVGLHARPAAVFTKRAAAFEADITAVKGERSASAKSLLSLLQLDIQPGDAFTLRADGPDADEALDALGELVHSWSQEAAHAADASEAVTRADGPTETEGGQGQALGTATSAADALPGGDTRLLDRWGEALAGLAGASLATALRRSEGRALMAEAVAPAPPIVDGVANVELVAAMGADLVCLNLYEPGAGRPLPGLEGLEAPPTTLGALRELLARPVGCNLEPEVTGVPEAVRATPAQAAAVADEGAAFVVVTANPGRGIGRAELERAVRTVRSAAPEVLCLAGRMHGAGGSEPVHEDDVAALVDAGAHGVLVPVPGTVPGVSEELARAMARQAAERSAISVGTVGTSQEGSNVTTIRSLALTAKRVGVDVHHLGDAGLGGIAAPTNVYAYSEAIRGTRHTWRRMAHGLRARWTDEEER